MDLSPYPQLTIPGKCRGQGILDLVVKGADREHPGAAFVPGEIIGSRARRGLGVEELAGMSWPLRTPYRRGVLGSYLLIHGRLTGTVSRPGDRSPDRTCGIVLRKVGTPKSRVLANSQSGRLAGKCNRKQTADGGPSGPHR